MIIKTKRVFLLYAYVICFLISGILFAFFFQLGKISIDNFLQAIIKRDYKILNNAILIQVLTLACYFFERLSFWIGQIISRYILINKKIELQELVFYGSKGKKWIWFIKNFGNKKLFTIITNDIDQAVKSYNDSILEILKFLSILIPIFGFFFFTNVLIGTYILFFTFFINFLSFIGRKKMIKLSLERKEKTKIFMEKIGDYLKNFQIISIKECQKHVYKEFVSSTSKEMEKTNLKNMNLITRISLFSNILVEWLKILTIITSSYFVFFWNTLTVGSILSIVGALSMFTPHTKGLMDAIRKIKTMKILFKKILPFSEQNFKRGQEIRHHFNKINVANLSYKIKDRYLFKNLNFVIEKGKKYGLIGPSGIGKTTLLEILSGMRDNYEGEIFLDNKNYRNLLEEEIRESIFFLNSKNIIFDVTPKENVTLWSKNRNSDLKLALARVNLSELVDSKIPSLKLSEGQKRRINVARVFFSRKQILILDEPLGDLDFKNRLTIEENLLKDKRTFLIASHYLNEKNNFFDYVFELNNEGIVKKQCKKN